MTKEEIHIILGLNRIHCWYVQIAFNGITSPEMLNTALTHTEQMRLASQLTTTATALIERLTQKENPDPPADNKVVKLLSSEELPFLNNKNNPTNQKTA